MDDDAALLHAYAAEGSESAYTALVRRHIDLVYATALRRVNGDAHLAADVAQQVFATLARQANRSWRPRVLGAWLHTATRHAAANAMTSEKRRRLREQAALDPALAASEDALPEWTQLRPVLDAAIDELPEPDRAAVVLRFLERRAFGEMGATLEISADAARMRTERALDKLRAALARRGITSTAAALGTLISSQPLVSAPAGLVGSIAASSFAATGAGVGAFAAGVASFMKLKTVVAGVVVLSAFLAGLYVGLLQTLDAPSLPAPETPRHSRLIADLRKENLALRTEADRLKAAQAKMAAPQAVPPAPPRAPQSLPSAPVTETRSVGERQRALVNNLRQLHAARNQFILEHGRAPSSSRELIGHDKYVRPFPLVEGEDYSAVSMTPGQLMTVTTSSGLTVTYDPDGNQTTRPEPTHLQSQVRAMHERLKGPMQAALQGYLAANPGAKEPNTEAGMRALAPYFATPQLGADFLELIDAMRLAETQPR